jgi:hypothetical protein
MTIAHSKQLPKMVSTQGEKLILRLDFGKDHWYPCVTTTHQLTVNINDGEASDAALKRLSNAINVIRQELV